MAEIACGDGHGRNEHSTVEGLMRVAVSFVQESGVSVRNTLLTHSRDSLYCCLFRFGCLRGQAERQRRDGPCSSLRSRPTFQHVVGWCSLLSVSPGLSNSTE